MGFPLPLSPHIKPTTATLPSVSPTLPAVDEIGVCETKGKEGKKLKGKGGKKNERKVWECSMCLFCLQHSIKQAIHLWLLAAASSPLQRLSKEPQHGQASCGTWPWGDHPYFAWKELKCLCELLSQGREEEENNSTNLGMARLLPRALIHPPAGKGILALVCGAHPQEWEQSPRVALTNTQWADHPLADGAKSQRFEYKCWAGGVLSQAGVGVLH